MEHKLLNCWILASLSFEQFLKINKTLGSRGSCDHQWPGGLAGSRTALPSLTCTGRVVVPQRARPPLLRIPAGSTSPMRQQKEMLPWKRLEIVLIPRALFTFLKSLLRCNWDMKSCTWWIRATGWVWNNANLWYRPNLQVTDTPTMSRHSCACVCVCVCAWACDRDT